MSAAGVASDTGPRAPALSGADAARLCLNEPTRDNKEKAVPHTQTPTPIPARIVGELLAAHPEAASLLGEASHRQALAEHSAATAGQEFNAAQAARLSYEELRHRLDPRQRRPVHFAAGLMLLVGIGAGLTVLNGLQLAGVLTGWMAVPVTIAAVAVWLTGAWLAALGSRDGHRALLAAIVGTAGVLSLLLAALHSFTALSKWPTVWEYVGASALGSLFIDVLAVGAAVLIARMEPASLFHARRRWQRARTGHQTALQLQRADTEAAAVAREAWLGLVRAHGSAVGGDGGEHVVRDSVGLASALQEAGRPRIGPPHPDT
jgi:hypothetical protein